MTRFLQKFDQLPKLSLGGELVGTSINGKFAELTAPTRKRVLYLITFHPCQSVSECLPSCIPAALRVLLDPSLIATISLDPGLFVTVYKKSCEVFLVVT
jgi:hypothetical protein